MKLGRHLFKNQQSIWGKPLIAYNQTKMDTLISEINTIENEEPRIFSDTKVSLETELDLLLPF